MKYELTLKCNGQLYKAGANNIEEAISAIKPPFFKTIGILKLKFGKQSAEKILRINTMKRMFADNDMSRVILGKNLKMVLK